MLTFAIAIPFGGVYEDGRVRNVPPEWALALANLEFPMGSSRVWLTSKRLKRDFARCTLVKEAIRLQAKYVFFIDDDTMPPVDALKKLYMELEAADENVVACGGIYTSKKPDPEPLVFMDDQGGPAWKWKAGDVFKCEGIATGCLLIRTSVFAKLPEPWFRDITSVEEMGDDPSLPVLPKDEKFSTTFYMTDDVYFCRKVKQAGFDILAHGGVLPIHWDEHGKAHYLPKDSPPMRGVDPKSIWYNVVGMLQPAIR